MHSFLLDPKGIWLGTLIMYLYIYLHGVFVDPFTFNLALSWRVYLLFSFFFPLGNLAFNISMCNEITLSDFTQPLCSFLLFLPHRMFLQPSFLVIKLIYCTLFSTCICAYVWGWNVTVDVIGHQMRTLQVSSRCVGPGDWWQA